MVGPVTSESPSVAHGRTRPSPIVIAAVTTVAMLLIGAVAWSFWHDDEGSAWGPSTSEEWLYDHYYNASRMGYAPEEWGGEPIHADALVPLINLNSLNLTLPVFMQVVPELTDERIKSTAETFYPGLYHSNILIDREAREDGSVQKASITSTEVPVEFRIYREGHVLFKQQAWGRPWDVPTCETAQALLLGWLEARGLLPDDIGNVSIRRAESQEQGTLDYKLTITRRVHGLLFGPDDFRNMITMEFLRGDLSVEYHWPELSLPFVITNVPLLFSTIDYHHLEPDPERGEMLSIDDELHYLQAATTYEMDPDYDTPVYFFLPYRHIISHVWDGFYGVIFPDESKSLVW